MFDQLFERSHALARHLSGPLVDERRRYLAHCAEQAMAKSTLRRIADLLMAAEEYLKLAERPFATISIQEIEEAGSRWSTRKSLPPIFGLRYSSPVLYIKRNFNQSGVCDF